jgi:hypothetical protein
MNNKIIFGLTLVLASLLLFASILVQRPLPTPQTPPTNGPTNPPEQDNESPKPPEDNQPEYVWGVDSASAVDQSFYECITSNYGEPIAFGRYLGTKEGVSAGLTTEEVEFLHNNGVQIILIYNQFTDATTFDKGVQEAEAAISLAEDIGAPEGVFIYADIEPSYPVDSDFILGWYDTIATSPYSPGIYGIFSDEEEVTVSYEEAISSNEELQDNLSIWHSGSPLVGVTSKEEAPEFRPEVPDFVPVSIWQYGIEGEECNIDTNLIDSQVLDQLW